MANEECGQVGVGWTRNRVEAGGIEVVCFEETNIDNCENSKCKTGFRAPRIPFIETFIEFNFQPDLRTCE